MIRGENKTAVAYKQFQFNEEHLTARLLHEKPIVILEVTSMSPSACGTGQQSPHHTQVDNSQLRHADGDSSLVSGSQTLRVKLKGRKRSGYTRLTPHMQSHTRSAVVQCHAFSTTESYTAINSIATTYSVT